MKRSFLAALLVAACATPPTLLAAQTPRDSAIAAQLKVPLDSMQHSVLPAITQYCATKGAVGYMKAACPILTRQLRSAWAADSTLIASTLVVAPPVQPPPVVPAPIDTTSTVFAASDFESGTIAPFTNPYAGVLPGAVDVVSDPTNSGHGKVLRIHYWNDPASGWYDNNDAIAPDPSDPKTHAGLGDEVIFTGDFYLPRSATTDTINQYGLRKLNYWCSGPTNHSCYVLATQPTPGFGDEQLMSSLDLQGASNLPCDCVYHGVTVSSNAWHRLTVDVRFNSTFATKDGKLRIVLDSTVVVDRSDVQWVDPLSTGALDWYDWRIGEQLNSKQAVDEYRYWDNLRFAIKRHR